MDGKLFFGCWLGDGLRGGGKAERRVVMGWDGVGLGWLICWDCGIGCRRCFGGPWMDEVGGKWRCLLIYLLGCRQLSF